MLFQGFESVEVEQRHGCRNSWELTAWPSSRKQRENTRNGRIFWNLRAFLLPSVTHHLQQDHSSWSFPNCSTNWGPSIQTQEPMGDHSCSSHHSNCLSQVMDRSIKRRRSIFLFLLWLVTLFYRMGQDWVCFCCCDRTLTRNQAVEKDAFGLHPYHRHLWEKSGQEVKQRAWRSSAVTKRNSSCLKEQKAWFILEQIWVIMVMEHTFRSHQM